MIFCRINLPNTSYQLATADTCQISENVFFTFSSARRYASAVLTVGRCLCLSATSRCSIETDGRIELVFGMEASFDLPYPVLQEN